MENLVVDLPACGNVGRFGTHTADLSPPILSMTYISILSRYVRHSIIVDRSKANERGEIWSIAE